MAIDIVNANKILCRRITPYLLYLETVFTLYQYAKLLSCNQGTCYGDRVSPLHIIYTIKQFHFTLSVKAFKDRWSGLSNTLSLNKSRTTFFELCRTFYRYKNEVHKTSIEARYLFKANFTILKFEISRIEAISYLSPL